MSDQVQKMTIMPELGLPMFDRTIHETNTWLQCIADELGTQDRNKAYHALRAVLFTLRDRLPVELAASFGAQLPLLIRGIFYEGFSPANQPVPYRTLAEWTQRIDAAYDVDPASLDSQQITASVFHCFDRFLDPGLLEKVFTALPEDVRDLWEAIPEAVAHPS